MNKTEALARLANLLAIRVRGVTLPKRHWIDYKLKEWSTKKEKFYKSWQKKMTITTLTTIKQSLYSFANSVSRLLIRFLLCTHRVTALWSITWEPGRCLRGKICGDVDGRTRATTARHTCKHVTGAEWFYWIIFIVLLSEAFGKRGVFENSIKEHAFTIFSFLKSLLRSCWP